MRMFTHLTTNSYQANLYPSSGPQHNAATPVLGLCLSGGGSRALTCALGQLSGLRSLPDPGNPAQTLLDRVDHLSSVSGGSWASVLYTFLPAMISDDAFLISPQAPGALFKDDPSVAKRQNVCYLAPNCLGNVPGQFNPNNLASVLRTLYSWGLFGNDQRWGWWWIAAVGEIVLKPFGLYTAFYDPNVNFPQPSQFFSLSDSYVQASITPDNPTLDPSQFYTTRAGRAPLIVNCNLLQDYALLDSPQIPVQATPIDSGIGGQSPDGTVVGGGTAESFAFTSELLGKGTGPNLASVTTERRYSLCDIAGCSSAFFAELLLDYINNVVFADIIAELRKILQSEGLASWEIDAIVIALTVAWDYFVDADASDIIPKYNYWPLGAVSQTLPVNGIYGFADGGSFDNSGIVGLLARTNANRILSFANTEIPLAVDPVSKQVMVDDLLPLLFGYNPVTVKGTYVSYGGMQPSEPLSYVQVFSDAGNAFAQLRQGLHDASTAGTGVLGTATAAFLQTLTTVKNPVVNIAAGRQIKVLWVYNNRVDNWQNAIGNTLIQADLQQGQSANPTGPLANFPHYDTGLQIELGAEAVNMLAQLSAWNVQQLQGQINQLLT